MQTIDPKGSFLKNLVLSLLLIGLTSVLIPIVLKQIDEQQSITQQRFQDELSRQDTILDAQAALLDTMAADFWSYALFASDVVVSRDERFGQADWHERAVDTYYQQTGPLLGKIRADISTLLRLAPRSTYDAFLQLYEAEVRPLDSCLLELMKIDAANANGESQPVRCAAATGKFAGASWETLADSIVTDELGQSIDRAFADLARVFRLNGASDDGANDPAPAGPATGQP